MCIYIIIHTYIKSTAYEVIQVKFLALSALNGSFIVITSHCNEFDLCDVPIVQICLPQGVWLRVL